MVSINKDFLVVLWPSQLVGRYCTNFSTSGIQKSLVKYIYLSSRSSGCPCPCSGLCTPNPVPGLEQPQAVPERMRLMYDSEKVLNIWYLNQKNLVKDNFFFSINLHFIKYQVPDKLFEPFKKQNQFWSKFRMFL